MTTSIEWAQNPDGSPGETWNPTKGCVEISPGCNACYARTFAERWRGIKGHTYEHGFDPRLAPEHLDKPMRKKKPTTYFVDSMSDLFFDGFRNEYIAAVFGMMAVCPQHRFIVLTKRAVRLPRWFAWMTTLRASDPQQVMHEAVKHYMGYDNPRRPAVNEHRWPLPNVWIGVSVEDRKHGVPRIDHLRQVPASVRVLSIEPLIEDLGKLDLTGIGWVIVGGESGSGARPMRLKWARDLIEQCRAASVPVFFKQAGEKPMISRKTHQTLSLRVLNDNATRAAPEGFVVLKVSGKGGDISELPGGPDAWPREFPEATR